MSKHDYFTVGNASYVAVPDDGLCIFAGDAPKRVDDKTTCLSLRAPFVLISDIIDDRNNIAAVLAEVLNENAHRFFSSAADAQSPDEEAPRADTGSPQERGQPDTSIDAIAEAKVMP